ncbi:MAG: ABC transporter ATP-binding protein [Anaerolineales bacterium]|nr:ABC transporter ATP-binding protein [Anaerolineales bacterium]MCX7754530.1 ABC transporter ATP-binding protein [Anaerolineales bacterium]MDW8277231.1 ABC transporter ATP-binding protein [Anaerolineales bacterium]
MTILRAEKLSLGYDTTPIVHLLDLETPSGQITALIGPNGCGKSTLLRGLARLLKPKHGAVLLDGRAIHTLPTRQLARVLGLLPQLPTAPEGITVRQLIAQGRYPHQTWFQQWGQEDETALRNALALTSLTDLADRVVDTLSGGQRQRAWIAMSLAQETDILLLDEPTTYLDLAHQLEVLELLVQLNRKGKTIIMVLHDLNHAAHYADHLIVLSDGRVVAQGMAGQVITQEIIRKTFGVESLVMPHPVTGKPLCLPLRRIA